MLALPSERSVGRRDAGATIRMIELAELGRSIPSTALRIKLRPYMAGPDAG